MLQLHGKKVIRLTAGGLTDVWKFFFRSTDNSSREKSAEVIVDTDTNLQVENTDSRRLHAVLKD
jgi:hypothetical protein